MNIRIVIAMIAALAASPALAADSYMTFGVGRGYLHHNGENMWWKQEGWDFTIDERSTVYRIGLGWKARPWLTFEANFHDLGEYHHFAAFVVPEQEYDARTQNCVKECSPTRWGYLSGSAYAVSLSALPSVRAGKWQAFGRLGWQWYKAKFKGYVSPADPKARHWEENDWFGPQRGSEAMFGFGIGYDRVTLELTQFPKIHANNPNCCSAYREARTIILSYRWDI